MDVIAVPVPQRMGTDIYIRLAESTPTTPGLFLGMYQEVLEVHEGEEPPLYLHLPDNIKDALLETFRPRVDPSERHLKDALGVRDRLMVLLEASTIGALPEAAGEWIQSRVSG